MAYKMLFLWVEGNDDERFFKTILIPRFKQVYNSIRIIKYAEKTKSQIDNYIKTIKSIPADYIFCSDINSSPCPPKKKERITNKYRHIDSDRIAIIIKEIESWYLAGIDEKVEKQLGISVPNNTDNITKEEFNKMIPQKFDSRVDFMMEILKNFSVDTAQRKNKSFHYFMKKYVETK